jgi:4-alpha-glucanotransferase
MKQDELIERRYKDALGKMRRVSADTLEKVRAALDDDTSGEETVRVVRAGKAIAFNGPADLVLENGSRESLQVFRAGGSRGQVRSRVPRDVPLGYHSVELHDSGRRVSLIVSPGRCHLPPGLRIWAWAVQLYAARSRRSWGIGDLGDLARLAEWSRTRGCGLLLVNPLHAASPVVPQQPSPYSPTTRRYLNPLYLSMHALPGARDLSNFDELVRAGTRLNHALFIDRDRVFRLKMRALAGLYRQFAGDPDFDRFVTAEGASLREYAGYCALAEEHGGAWRRWPSKYRDPRSSDVRRFVDARADRVRFHQWIQWHLDKQLERAAHIVPVMQDLPIGIDPEGADAWAWQDVLAHNISVGAPPDEFNTRGQNWGLPPFVPGRLKRAAYRPFIETIRGTIRHAGGLRIDHVMGLYRLFWIPEDMEPSEGAYVRNAADDLLAIIALESERAQAIVVGEDLGTVDARAREQLMAAGVLSYRLLWFEQGHPSTYPEQALAAVTTHDLPTIAGLWTGVDLEAQRRLHLNPNEAGTLEMRQRLARLTRSEDDARVPDVIKRTYGVLSRAPSVIVAATLEDAAAVETRPNMPGTVTEWPNWSQPLPAPLETLLGNRACADIARTLGRGRIRKSRPAPRSRRQPTRRRRAG